MYFEIIFTSIFHLYSVSKNDFTEIEVTRYERDKFYISQSIHKILKIVCYIKNMQLKRFARAIKLLLIK